MGTCIRAFSGLSACSLVTGLQDTVRVPYRLRKVHVQAPYGALWVLYEHGGISAFSFEGTIRSRADAVRAWKYPYDRWCRALHAYGPSMGYLRVLWSRGCKIPYVYLTGYVRFTCRHPRGPCGFYTGMGASLRSVLRELYGPVRMQCGLGNIRTIGGAGPYGVRWGPQVHTWVIFT